VSQRVRAVQDAYNGKGGAVEIAEADGKFYMRVRQQYVPFVKSFASASEITPHALKTLAYVAKSEGITKHALFLKLGGGIYEDINELVERGFVTTKRAGRTKAVSTTAKFKAYFGQTQ
jgi:chromosome segregation and condensation protein ScpB